MADPAVAARASGLVLVDVVPGVEPARVRSWLGFHGLGGRYTRLVEDVLGSAPALLATAGALDMPILVVHGGHDSPLREADVDRLRAANARVAVAGVPAAGHLVARDAPEVLADLVATWLCGIRHGTVSTPGEGGQDLR